MSFSVNLRTSDFVKRRLVSGPIWLEMDGQLFPNDEWYDFPVVILGWWLNNMRPLVLNQATRCQCPFMDGPYRFDISTQKQADWLVSFIRDDLDGEKCLLERAVDPLTLTSKVLTAATAVADLCRQKGWASEDLTTLEKEIQEATLAVSRLTALRVER